MSEPYLQKFELPNKVEITSVVIDEEDFNALCDELHGIIMANEDNERVADAQIESLKAAKMLPLIARGVKTEFVFERFGIETDRACIIVRGHGKELAQQLGITIQ